MSQPKFPDRRAIFHQEAGTLDWMTVIEHNHILKQKDEELARHLSFGYEHTVKDAEKYEARIKTLEEALEKCARAMERNGPGYALSRLDIKTFAQQALVDINLPHKPVEDFIKTVHHHPRRNKENV